MIAVWCPDWPVTALGHDAEQAVAVVVANRVVASSHSARQAGVLRGLRRREAQARCPQLIVCARNETAEARAFEPVVAALESVAPGVEINRPGLAAIGVRGPARYFGGENGVLHALSRALAATAGSTGPPGGAGAAVTDLSIGIADGAFAAEQAARRALVVDPGGSPAFLAPMPIETLDPTGDSALVDLLRRLGLRTLGAFAALSARDVLARFGPDGAAAHRQAGGHDPRPVSGRRPAVEFTASLDFEPALDRVDTVAFSTRGLAERFIADLAGHGLACSCLELSAVTEDGQETVRRWRHAGVLGATDVLDRIRWQLEGWLSGANRPTSGVRRIELVPVETVPTGAHQQALWGSSGANSESVERALSRVATLLGHGSVFTPVIDGGRDPRSRTRLVPWGDEPVPLHSPEQPWPGQLPSPLPTVLLDPPRPARLVDDTGHRVVVTERGAMPRPPSRFAMAGAQPVTITSWAGPWPVDERWWAPDAVGMVVRCQLVDMHGRAYLVKGSLTGDWVVEGIYD